jgi:hypothetical protein
MAYQNDSKTPGQFANPCKQHRTHGESKRNTSLLDTQNHFLTMSKRSASSEWEITPRSDVKAAKQHPRSDHKPSPKLSRFFKESLTILKSGLQMTLRRSGN